MEGIKKLKLAYHSHLTINNLGVENNLGDLFYGS